MGLLEEGLARIEARQLQRLADIQAAEKRDRQAYKFATYQGKNTVDGTDIVSVNGATTSGFKLMSNAALSKGDRVSLRPNQQGGLQRVDAQNLPPDVAIEDEKIFADVSATLKFLFFWVYSTYGYSSAPQAFGEISVSSPTPLIDYIYDGDKIRYKKKTKLEDLPSTVFTVIEDTTNPAYVVGMSRALSSFSVLLNTVDGEDKNELTINLNQPLPTYPDPWIEPVTSAGRLVSPVYGALVQFEIFFPEKKFKRKFRDIESNDYTESDSPFEFEILINDAQITVNPLDKPITISFSVGIGWYLYYFYTPAIAPSLSQYTMSFRFRKRGNQAWFSL